MTANPDRLYELLPVIYRQRDAEQNYPLRDFLRVFSEQVNLVEADIAQLYENWFIETAEDWVVPYIADLSGYRPVHEAGEPGNPSTVQAQARNKILIPRREVANTLGYRRRKGTLALLELLANDVAGWPARAAEFYKLLGWTQALNHQRPTRGQTVDLRWGSALGQLDGPFDPFAHTVDVRRINSRHSQGWHNIPSVGLFIWRLKAYSVTRTPAYGREEAGPHCYTFSVLGNDTPLYTNPMREADPTDIAGELNLPVAIGRKAFEDHKTDYYGPDKSLMIWQSTREGRREPVSADKVIPADLTGWHYTPPRGFVAVDPELGRIAFPPRHVPKYGVWVSYHYGFSKDMGGGEYKRSLSQPQTYTLYPVGQNEKIKRLGEAIARWKAEQPPHAVIEITDSGVYVEPISVELAENQTLQLRAANRKRPVIRLLDWQTDLPDALSVILAPDSHFTLDGLLIAGRGMQVRGATNEDDQLLIGQSGITIRHSTLVPGWSLRGDCAPNRPAEPSLEVINASACVTIDHSIVGAVRIVMDSVREDPIPIHVYDSIVDATRPDNDALCGPSGQLAHAVANIARSTVIGCLCLHAVQLAEDSIFMGTMTVGRRQLGCVRFCYVTSGSRTPRRYHCQPDLVEAAAASEIDKAHERLRVRPKFNNIRYGPPTYCQLALTCAEEIRRGAEDESEMGVFHDLYQPQREANLRARLDEFTPADMNAGIIFAS
jgi:hypothetical protein